jgi:uncharacterized membrane protein YbhN (UPF0104 family)
LITRKRLIHLTGTIVAVVAFAYFGRTFLHYWEEASEILREPRIYAAGAAAVGLSVAGYAASAFSWVNICSALAMPVRLRVAAHIYFVSQFGKYLPGNIAQHAGRLAMGVQQKLPGVTVAASQIIEIVLVVGTLGTIAAATGWKYITRLPGNTIMANPTLAIVSAIGALAAAVLTILALKRFKRMNHLYSLFFQCLSTRDSFLSLVKATTLVFVNVACAILALYVVIKAVDPQYSQSIAMVSCVYTVSWLAGFVTPGAPAGLGIREAVMLTLLSQNMVAADAVAISLIFRLATTATDSIVFGIGLCLRPARRNTCLSSDRVTPGNE